MDPATGRFLSQDSFGGFQASPITTNRFLYANDDPANEVDPSGHSPTGQQYLGAYFLSLFASIFGFHPPSISDHLVSIFTAPPTQFLDVLVDRALAEEIAYNMIQGNGLGPGYYLWFNSTGTPAPLIDALVRESWVKIFNETQRPDLDFFAEDQASGGLIAKSNYGDQVIDVYPQFWGFPFLGLPGTFYSSLTFTGFLYYSPAGLPTYPLDIPFTNINFWSQTAVVLHEMSHIAAGTTDQAGAGNAESYGPVNAHRYAVNAPGAAAFNADNYRVQVDNGAPASRPGVARRQRGGDKRSRSLRG